MNKGLNLRLNINLHVLLLPFPCHFTFLIALVRKKAVATSHLKFVCVIRSVTVVETNYKLRNIAQLNLRVKKWVNSEQAKNRDRSMSSPQVVDWLKCIICQKETA